MNKVIFASIAIFFTTQSVLAQTALNEKVFLCEGVSVSIFGLPSVPVTVDEYPLQGSKLYTFLEISAEEITVLRQNVITEKKVNDTFGYEYRVFAGINSTAENMRIIEFPNNIVLSNLEDKLTVRGLSGGPLANISRWETIEIPADQQEFSSFIRRLNSSINHHKDTRMEYEVRGDAIFIDRASLVLFEMDMPSTLIVENRCDLIDASESDGVMREMEEQARKYYEEELEKLISTHSTEDNKL
jgi:hypothetical protein